MSLIDVNKNMSADDICYANLTASVFYTVSQKTSHLKLAITFDTHEWILITIGRDVTDKVGKHFNMPLQITCASALPGKTGKNKNHIFHSNAVSVDSAAAVGLCCLPERKNCHL